jgi:hypothetical protein
LILPTIWKFCPAFVFIDANPPRPFNAELLFDALELPHVETAH